MDRQAVSLTERSSSGRYVELDSLRGIAAFTVICCHLSLAFSYKPGLVAIPLVAGYQSVLLFFVLSGFVLSLPFWNKGTTGPYPRYILRRFFRIYVPFAASAVLALLGAHFFLHSSLPLGNWFHNTWQTDLTGGLIMRQFLLWPDHTLNTAFWSLRYEVQLSIAFPLLLLMLRVARLWQSLIVILCIYLVTLRLPGSGNFHYWHDTVEYGVLFLFGALVASRRDQIRQAWLRWPKALQLCALIVSFVVYFYGDSAAIRIGKPYASEFFTALGACGMVICALYFKPMQTALKHPIPEYLGRISYSMYLVHGTILFILLNLLYGKVNLLAFAGIFIVTTFVFSHVFCVCVEEPSLRLGKRFAMRLKG